MHIKWNFMANFDGSGYSDSFELDDSNSEDFSHDDSDVLSELKKTLESAGTEPVPVTLNKNDKKPPAPKRERHLRLSNGGIDLRNTVRSPISMAQHLNQSGPLAKSNDDVTDGGSHPHTVTSNSDPARPLRFKQAVGTVQKLQSTAKHFRNSDEVREVVFKEWLVKKEENNLRTRQSLSQSEIIEAKNNREKELHLSKRSIEAVKKWTGSKEARLQSRKKQISIEAKQQAEEAEERLNRHQEGKVAAEKWREENRKIVVQRQIEKVQKKEEEERVKKEEKEEKIIENKQAFQSWSQHKDGVMREKARKTKEAAKKLELTQQQQISEQQIEAKKLYDAWKAQKDEKIKSTKTLYSYKMPVVCETPWQPARAMQYSYPKSKETMQRKAKAKDTSHASMESYSMSSFESEADVKSSCSAHSSAHSSASSAMDSVSRMASPTKGQHKTIQVCCQTLQYLCTCDLQD